LKVAQPFGGDVRYDAIVDNGQQRLLVQVKSTSSFCRKNVYQVKAARQEHYGNRKAPKAVGYLASEIDFLAVYLVQEKTWYILPHAALRGRRNLTMYSAKHGKAGPYGEYREAWHLLGVRGRPQLEGAVEEVGRPKKHEARGRMGRVSEARMSRPPM
jgi:hypothetical protein